jgi:hypothetical protein
VEGESRIGDVEKFFDHQPVCEEDYIEEEGLRGHEDESEDRSTTVFADHVLEDLAEWGVVADSDPEPLAFRPRKSGTMAFANAVFDVGDNLASVVLSSAKHKPAGLSGTNRRRRRTMSPREPPMPKA